MRTHVVFIGLALGFGTACSPSEEASPPLVGEWEIWIDDRGSGGASGKDGIMVFDERIPCYCPADSNLPEDAIVGRAYLNLATMGRSPRQTTDSYFALGHDADYYEEVIARVDGRQVVINTRGPAGATFEGLLVGDSIEGRWAYLQHGDTMSAGAFVMGRRDVSEYVDSALVRSRRGVSEWVSEPPLTSAEPMDTAPVIHEVPPE